MPARNVSTETAPTQTFSEGTDSWISFFTDSTTVFPSGSNETGIHSVTGDSEIMLRASSFAAKSPTTSVLRLYSYEYGSPKNGVTDCINGIPSAIEYITMFDTISNATGSGPM